MKTSASHHWGKQIYMLLKRIASTYFHPVINVLYKVPGKFCIKFPAGTSEIYYVLGVRYYKNPNS